MSNDVYAAHELLPHCCSSLFIGTGRHATLSADQLSNIALNTTTTRGLTVAPSLMRYTLPYIVGRQNEEQQYYSH